MQLHLSRAVLGHQRVAAAYPGGEYAIFVDGQYLMRGKLDAVGVIFGNLIGENFLPRTGRRSLVTHEQWLGQFNSLQKSNAKPGQAVQLRAPDGQVMRQGVVGEFSGMSLSPTDDHVLEPQEVLRQMDRQGLIF